MSRHSKLYQYLEQTNALSGTDVQIKEAIKQYRKHYQAQWRRRKRELNKEVTITLNPKEFQIITVAANKHKRPSRTQFCKEAALAYCTQAFVVPDIFLVNSIKEHITMTYSSVQKLSDENGLRYDIAKELLRRIEALEAEILKCLQRPQSLDELIQNELKRNPAYAEVLYYLLQNVQK